MAFEQIDPYLASIANSYFQTERYEPLLGAIASRIEQTNLALILQSGCRPLQHLAWKQLSEYSERLVSKVLLPAITEAPPGGRAGLFRALLHDAVPISDDLIEFSFETLSSTSLTDRMAAADVIAYRQPNLIKDLLDRGTPVEQSLLRRFCVADEPQLVAPLMDAFGYPDRTPPPTIGFLVSPSWLVDYSDKDAPMVDWLVRECGYCDDPITDNVLNLLSNGFSYVTERMTSESRMNKIAHRWQRRIRSFVWRLLPPELELIPDDDKPLDLDNPLEVDLFVAAVRDTDRMLFLDRKQLPPFDKKRPIDGPSPVCFHAASRYVRRKFVDEPLEWAARWNIPPAKRGEFLIDHARIQLEPDLETRTLADLNFRSRWNPNNFRIHVRTFLPPNELSPGAKSIVALAEACGLRHDELADWLLDAEFNWSPCLTPIGIEVQIPQVNPDRFGEWKELLPLLGIPSPVRPEFGGMLEAAFRPARSFHAMALGPLLLARLGIIEEPQDLCLHISVQGDLDDKVRSILFPQLFIHPSERLKNRPDTAMTRVMSKGLAHLHNDAENIDVTGPLQHRTELRAFRILAESATVTNDPSQTAIQLARGYISDVIATHILCSIATSNCLQCTEQFDIYESEIGHAVADLPEGFKELFESNFYESTGDPTEVTLLRLLPVFRRWANVRAILKANKMGPMLDQRFRQIRNRRLLDVLEHWSSEHGISTREIVVRDNEIEFSTESENSVSEILQGIFR
jgi:hypothetical protein